MLRTDDATIKVAYCSGPALSTPPPPPFGGVRIPTTRTHLVRERLVSPWETVGPRFDSQKPRVSGAGARWPAGVLPLVSFDVGGAWWLFACRHGRLQALRFRNFIGCYPRIEWSLLPLVFNTPPDWVASVTISRSLEHPNIAPTRPCFLPWQCVSSSLNFSCRCNSCDCLQWWCGQRGGLRLGFGSGCRTS